MSGLYIVHGIVELKTSFDHLAMIYDIRMIYEAKRNAYFLNPKTKMLPFHVLCCRAFVWLKFFSSHHQSFGFLFNVEPFSLKLEFGNPSPDEKMEGIELARTEERSNISRICVYPRNNIESHNSTKWSANRAIFKILFPNTIFYTEA